jgi:hypothetical protein
VTGCQCGWVLPEHRSWAYAPLAAALPGLSPTLCGLLGFGEKGTAAPPAGWLASNHNAYYLAREQAELPPASRDSGYVAGERADAAGPAGPDSAPGYDEPYYHSTPGGSSHGRLSH